MSIYRGRNRKEFALASSLYDSVMDNDYRGVLLLLEKGADANIILPGSGISPLHLAVGNDLVEFALKTTKSILQNGGNPNLRSDDGLTPLHISSAWGRISIVELLLNCGANPHQPDDNYKLPIDYAIEYQHEQVASVLTQCMKSATERIEENECLLVLDKVILNNGVVQAEYNTDMGLYGECCNPLDHLQLLPQTATSEYVNDWCRTHTFHNTTQYAEVDGEALSNVSTENDRFTLPNYPFVNCRPRKPARNVIENFSLSYESSPKYKFRQSMLDNHEEAIVPPDASINSFCKHTEASRESGIVTLPDIDGSPDDVQGDEPKGANPAGSDYFTCNDVSGSSANIADDIDVCLSTLEVASIEVGVTEVYKYTDDEEGVVLYEKRFLKNMEENVCNLSLVQTQSSKLSSIPNSLDYDTDRLRTELANCGFTSGPITKTTKRLYLRKLQRLRLQRGSRQEVIVPVCDGTKVYSAELEHTLRSPSWSSDLSEYKCFEEIIRRDFDDPSRKWREGTNKCSFTYLLLDPRITNDLPNRNDSVSMSDAWRTFLASIFYVGKGKRARPYSHLYEAARLWREPHRTGRINEKLEHILGIWRDDFGVVCLHVFQNVMPVEAYTREAAMITALKIKNIKNARSGEFYGTASTWTSHQQRMFGVFLLHKAMAIFLNEGERQLGPLDIN